MLPGIEDPTSPAHKRSAKRGGRQRNHFSAINHNLQDHVDSRADNDQELGDEQAYPEHTAKSSQKTPSKRKRRLPVDGSPLYKSTGARKKRKSVDYKSAGMRTYTQEQVENTGQVGPKEGPFTEGELAKLYAFRDQYCEENEITSEQFIQQVHANAHNNTKNISFWNEVTDVLPYRTRHSIQRLCRRRFHNYTKRGQWTEEEDEELRLAHVEHGNKWKIIGEQIERMPEDCRDRWRNYIKDGGMRNKDEWTPYEVECLRAAVAQCQEAMRVANQQRKKHEAYGRDFVENPKLDEKTMINWGVVSEIMGGSRSRLQCSFKWKQLEKSAQREANKPEEDLRRIIERGPKPLRLWRRKRAEKKYKFMLPGDKYELLQA